MQTITQYGLAAMGVIVGVALVSVSTSVTISAILLMGLIPMLTMFAAVMVAAEAERVARAGRHLRTLESRLNGGFPDGSKPLRWETHLADGTQSRISGYGLVVVAVIVSTAIIALGLGGYLLGREGLWTGFIAAESVDLMVLATFAIWSATRFKHLGALTAVAADTAPGVPQPG